MGLFDEVLEKLGLKDKEDKADTSTADEHAERIAKIRADRAERQSKEVEVVDVLAKLEKPAEDTAAELNWRTSIVDLLKLLNIESSYEARVELAKELGIPDDKMDDSAEMNIWLHNTVLRKIAENGGNIPRELYD